MNIISLKAFEMGDVMNVGDENDAFSSVQLSERSNFTKIWFYS